MIILDRNCRTFADLLKIAAANKSEPILVSPGDITDIIEEGPIILKYFAKCFPDRAAILKSEIQVLNSKIDELEMFREAKYEHYKLANEIIRDFVNIFNMKISKKDLPPDSFHKEKIPVRSVFKDVSLMMLWGFEKW